MDVVLDILPNTEFLRRHYLLQQLNESALSASNRNSRRAPKDANSHNQQLLSPNIVTLEREWKQKTIWIYLFPRFDIRSKQKKAGVSKSPIDI